MIVAEYVRQKECELGERERGHFGVVLKVQDELFEGFGQNPDYRRGLRSERMGLDDLGRRVWHGALEKPRRKRNWSSGEASRQDEFKACERA